jgi:xylulokinase
VSDASGMLLFDVKNRKWSKKMCELCGINESQLARIFESYEVIGNLSSEAAKALGLSENVKVIAGAGDNAAAAIGTGTIKNGDCNLSLGTSGTIFIAADNYSVDENNALHSFAHAQGRYHLMGCMLSAASCNKWWVEDILGSTDYSAEQQNIDKLGYNNVYFLPYLMGERSPHNDPDARGCFIGMSMDTSRSDMTQAILEGVAFALRDSFEVAKKSGIDIKRTKICGGGAKSPLWKRMIANIFNISVDSIESEEGPALGAAMLAAVGCGTFANVEDAADKIVKVTGTVEPDPETAQRYEEKYQKFKQIYPALKSVYKAL